MNITKVFLLAGFSGLGGLAIGYFFHMLLSLQKKNSADLKTKQILLEAKDKAQAITEEAAKKAQAILDSAKQEEKNSLIQTRKIEERILQREESLEKQRIGIEKSNTEIYESIEKLKKKKEEIEGIEQQKLADLQKVASMTEEEAKSDLMKATEKKYEEDILGRIKKLESFGRDEFEKRAREILVTVIQRLASSTASEVTTTTVPIPSDDLKGKISGRWKEWPEWKLSWTIRPVQSLFPVLIRSEGRQLKSLWKILFPTGEFSRPELKKWWRKPGAK